MDRLTMSVKPTDPRERRSSRMAAARSIATLGLLLATGCPRESAPQAPTTLPSSKPALTQPAIVKPVEPVKPAQPKPPARPKPGWTVFDAAFEVDRDATIDAKMTNARRMLVKTDNIRRLRIDLNNLPGGSDARGPWNLQIDGQGIELTGRRGRVLTLERSEGGRWDVVEARN